MSGFDRALELHERSCALHEERRLAEAESACREAIAIVRELEGESPDFVNMTNDLVGILSDAAKYADALEEATRAKHALERLPEFEGETASLIRARALGQRGTALRTLGRYDEAETDLLEAVRLSERELGPDHPQTATSLNYLGMLYKYWGRVPAALDAYERALRIVDPESTEAASLWHNVGGAHHAAGRFAEAEPAGRRAWEIRRKLAGDEHPDTVADLCALAGILDGLERWEESEPMYRRALVFWEELVGPDHYEIAVLLNNLAGVCAATARPDEAEELYRRAIRIKRTLLGDEHPELALTLTNLATLMRERERFEEGRALATEAQRILQGSSLPEEHPLRVYVGDVLRDLA
ncbi:MAG TPA: tetratricopeptide repeat protein [Thermoanaerobaculia bacterium]|nr:tetratricopeptide repeat protein [Thermoanaerobaculia bacterium]